MNERTPLLGAARSDGRGDRSLPPRWRGTAGIALCVVAITSIVVLVLAAAMQSPSLSHLRFPPASSHVDLLQWSILMGAFALSVVSFHMARTNHHTMRQHSAIHPSDEDTTELQSRQQRAMLSLATLVCNYGDLFAMAHHATRRHKHMAPYNFLFSALKAATHQMLDKGINRAFECGLTGEVTSTLPDAKEQFTLYTAHLLDAASHEKGERWAHREIVEGNERLLVQLMSYLTSHNAYLGGEGAVETAVNRIDGLLDVHLRMLESHQSDGRRTV